MQIGARRRRLLIATATTKSQNASGGVAAWHAGVTCNGRATGHISSLNVYTPWHMNASPPWRFADESSTLTTDSRTDTSTANCILMANEPHAGTQNHNSPACPRRAGLQSSRGAGGEGGGARAPATSTRASPLMRQFGAAALAAHAHVHMHACPHNQHRNIRVCTMRFMRPVPNTGQ